MPKPPRKSDEELIKDSLRAVLESEETSGKALAARAQAARQLALMNGLRLGSEERPVVDADYPMEDFWEQERVRRARVRARESRRVA
jgi:hypothetical protein